jgi:hypothetical protein
VSKPTDTRISSDIIIDDTDDDKILVAAKVINGDEEYKEGAMIIV